MAEKTIHLSNGTEYAAELVVYRDYIESNGKWRLFWENPNETGTGVQEQSTVTGQPFFSTMREAVAYGLRRYGLSAARASF